MGKRTRKRATDGSSRAARDALRAEQAPAPGQPRRPAPRRGGERPSAPWGSFPLTELVVLLGIGLCIAGFALGITSGRGQTAFVAGMVLGSLAGLEMAIRDHYAGYRSHTTMLAGACAVPTMIGASLLLSEIAPGLPIWVVVAVGVIVFGLTWPLFRRTFQHRSGGAGFR